MSLFSTYSAASINGFKSYGRAPENFNLLYSIETTANKDSRYTYVGVSRENIGNGQFIISKQSFIGNVVIRNVANTFNKTISNLTANSFAGDYNPVINEQGNIVIVGNGDYIKVYEYQGTNYTLISNLRPKSNISTFNGACIDISSNANTMVAGCLGGNQWIAVYNRLGNSFTLSENIEKSNISYSQFGSTVSISADANTLITSGIVSSNTTSGRVLIYNYSNGNYILNTIIESPGASFFGDNVNLNATGDVATITALGRLYIYRKNANSWTLQGNLMTSRGVGANNSAINIAAINEDGSTILFGNNKVGINDTGAMENYYRNGVNYQLYQSYTWANQYANCYFGYNLDGDNSTNYIAVTNFFNGANSNVHVLSVYKKE